MADWIERILGMVKFVNCFKESRRRKRINELKNKLVRQFEYGQRHFSAAYSASLDNLEADGVIKRDEREEAREALTELVADELLTHDSSSYYLRGRAPRTPYP